MFLGNPLTEDLIELNIYGKGLGETNCINWFLSEHSWITNITIGGNAEVGLTYIQMYTSQGTLYSRGSLDRFDEIQNEVFTREKPLVGL